MTAAPAAHLRDQRVVDAALALADARGLRGVTIRKLAREVGLPPMTLHGRFRSKDELLDAMFRRATERAFVVRAGATWQEALAASCRHARAALLEHPHWVALLTRVTVPLSSLAFFDAILRRMHRRGCAEAAAVHCLSSALGLTVGFVMVERLMGGAGGAPVPRRRLLLVGRSLRGAHDALRGFARVAGSFDEWTFDEAFDVALSSLLSGMPAEWTRTALRKRRARLQGA